MSDFEYDDDIDSNDSNSGRGLRGQFEDALKRLKAAEKKIADYEAADVQRKASEVLTGKGYAPAVARLAVKDGVDVSDEKAVDKWLTENGDLFVKADANQPADGETPPNAQQQEQPVPEGIANTYAAIGGLHAAASPAQVNAVTAALAALPETATPDQVLAAMRGL